MTVDTTGLPHLRAFMHEQNKLYDPDYREGDRNFTVGKPETDPDRIGFLINAWKCGVYEHGECWTTSHLSTREVGVNAATCADSCGCWRHTILAWASQRREDWLADRVRQQGENRP